jgi:hypothetical protein
MDEISDDLIFDTIMESAKERIDYPAFAAMFPFNADNFVSSMIYGLALGSRPPAIARKIAVQVSMTCNFVDEPAVVEFIEGNETALAREVSTMQMALRMLNDGDELQTVYEAVLEALKQ